MNTLRMHSARVAAGALMLLALPLSAAAQEASALNDATAVNAAGAFQAASLQGARSQGPLQVERVTSGVLVTPEVKVTTFDGKTSEVVGGDVGWLADKSFFIGGGGYWLANTGHDRNLAYGGLVLGLFTPVDKPFAFGVKTLLGGGRATVTRSLTFVNDSRNGPQFFTQDVRLSDSVGVVEPEADAVFRLGGNFRVTAGVGYRWVGRERGSFDRLSGATGTVGLQIGG